MKTTPSRIRAVRVQRQGAKAQSRKAEGARLWSQTQPQQFERSDVLRLVLRTQPRSDSKPCAFAALRLCVKKSSASFRLNLFAAGLLLASAGISLADVHYVDVNSTNATPPYTNWATAATSIQDAVDGAVAGDEIVVTNGIYATGGRAVYGTMTNRVAVDKPLTLRSVNGPEFTVIRGFQVPGTTNGDGAIRCVYLTNGASLSGFTLTNGATRAVYDNPPYPESSGGALWCASTNGAMASTCVVAGNSAYFLGGGAFQGTLNNCMLNGNSAVFGGGAADCTLINCSISGNSASNDSGGGGAYECTLINCTLSGNSGGVGGGAFLCRLNNCTLSGNSAYYSGGGADYCTLNNCIVYFNTAPKWANYDFYGLTTLNYCCTTPLPTNGVGNISLDPKLASPSHLSAASPCRGAGNAAYASGTDIDGEPWASPPSIGCDEYHAGALAGPLSVGITASLTNVLRGFSVQLIGLIEGRTRASSWDFGDGITVSNQPYTSHAWAALGDYTVVLRAYNESQPGGASATVTVHVVAQPVHYVAIAGANPAAPYSSWATAARNIQDAVDAATVPGALVLVTNGIYASGGRAMSGTMTNRVAVNKPLTLRSVNGPQFTIIQGRHNPGTGTGDGAIRCVYLTNGASLSGFTLTNGATRAAYESPPYRESSGGGLWCESTNTVVVSNCVLAGNSASYSGGGAYQGTLNDCTFSGNSDGAAGCMLNHCTLSANSGGGAYSSTLNSCALTGNSSYGANGCTLNSCTLSANSGAGAYSSTLNNCALTHNSDGGAFGCTLSNCTLSGNGGGASYSTLMNCILYFNTPAAGGNSNYDSSCILNYCCTIPPPTNGVGNISLDPQLASASHLSAGSPCRGAGNAAYAGGTDIDGEAWSSPPSMGCDEHHAGAVTGALSVGITASFTTVAAGFTVQFTALVEGRTTASLWDFGDGITAANQPYAAHAWTALGDYTVILRAYNESQPGGVSATAIIHVVAQPVHYVDAGSVNPIAPYASWAAAAATIQDGVDAATVPGALVLVTNGIYATGGRLAHDGRTNRVAGSKLLTLRSVNGPQFTVIDGLHSVRCCYLTNGASLSGFTMTNGVSDYGGGGVFCESTMAVVSNCVIAANSGGGANGGTLNNCALIGNSPGGASQCVLNNCALTGNSTIYSGGGAYACTLNNCTLTGNFAQYDGGGTYYSTLNNCALTGNSASRYGGGANYSTLNNCTLSGNSANYGGAAYYSVLTHCMVIANSASNFGGGAYSTTLNNCMLTGNSAQDGGGACGDANNPSTLNTCTLSRNCASRYGGGAYQSRLNNCTLTGNSATNYGGGAHSSTLNNCTVSGNWGGYYGGGVFQGTLSNCTLTGNSAINYGGGASSSTLNNCIVYFNTAGNGPNYDSSCTLNYCCTMPLPGYGAGNISLDPQLASPSHLSASSPCRGAGNRAYASGADIDGEAWAIPPSTGCDEYHAGSLTGPLSVSASAGFAIVTMSFAVPLTGQIDGRPTASTWDFGDGVTLTNRPYASHAWTALGDYSVILRAFNESQPGGISATVTVHVVAQPVHYVAIASASPVAPYTSWATAATNIQDAVDAATVPGALVLVTNGIYATGGRTTIGDNTTDRVAVEKPLIVRSISGPQATTIDGSQWARCVYLTHGARLSGFTLTNGAGGGAKGGTLNDCTLSGNSLGAVSSTLNNCTVTGNSGWGAYDCTLNNCALTANSGTGAYSCRLNNCTLTGNSGGGAYSSTLNNCIVYFNQGANYDSSCTLNYCCASPPPTNGVGSISLDPQLASASHLSAASPCRGAGNAAYASGVDIDIDGEAWASPPSIGCDEYHAGAVTGPLNVGLAATFTNVAVGFGVELTALIQGRTTISVWEFGDGFVEINQPYATHAWEAPGDYLVALWSFNESHPEGVRATVTVHVVAGVHYVAANSGNPTAPYTSWATAATRIQDAINAAIEPGSLVLVTNGIYAPIDARGLLTVRSVNGPQVTGISGGGLVRCARLAGAASLSGFTLNHGHAIFGGGVYCETKAAVVSNCVVSGNSAYFYGAGSFGETAYGGGAYGGTLNNCALSGNSAGRYRYGARGPVNQVGGGGAYNSTLNNCTLTGNSAIGDYYSYSYWTRCGGGGGGLDPGNVRCHYTISAGTIANGGAAYGCILNNCTLAGNSASQSGGGSSSSTLNNCIILDGSSGSSLNSCWTTDPLFVAGNLRLQSNSPCINAGNNAYAPGSTDLDGRPRIVGGTVDIGAYEFQPDISGAFIGYLQQYGLPTDGSADITDSDGDGMDNRQEWIAGTNPTDATSLLRLLVPVATPTGLFLRWNGDTNHAYFIERTTALKPPLTFSLLRSNVPGLFGTTTFTDTTAPSNGAAFYRIGTDSTNGSSSLWLQTPVFVPASVVVIWTSVANRSYFLERATNLAAPMLFTPLATSIPGQTGTTIYADTNAIGSGPFFYRVGVSTP